MRVWKELILLVCVQLDRATAFLNDTTIRRSRRNSHVAAWSSAHLSPFI